MVRLSQWLLVALAVAVLVGLSAPVLAEKAKKDDASQGTFKAQGKIESVSPEQNRLVLRDRDNKEWSFRLNKDAQVRLQDKDAKLADLKPGDEVIINYGVMASAIHAGREGRNYDVTAGEITKVNNDGESFMMKDKNGKEWTFHTGKNSRISANDREGKVSDLKVGDHVALQYVKEGNRLVACDCWCGAHAMAPETTTGKIEKVSATDQRLVLRDANGKERTFQLGRHAQVRMDDKEAKLADLQTGQDVTVNYQFVVKEIRSTEKP
jgi:Cu/Ag efflux protein CusF